MQKQSISCSGQQVFHSIMANIKGDMNKYVFVAAWFDILCRVAVSPKEKFTEHKLSFQAKNPPKKQPKHRIGVRVKCLA